MKVKMTLCSDAIFGSGDSVPGGEDISVLCDGQGFPYYKGSTFKGIFREEFLRYLDWTGIKESEANAIADAWLGYSGDDSFDEKKVVFSDFVVSGPVKQIVLQEIGESEARVKAAFTHLRTFTAMDENGTVKDGSMRVARCVNQGITLCGEIRCSAAQEETVCEVLGMIKWVGSMRNRGFGKVKVSAE